MHTFGLSHREFYVGVALLLLVPPHAERILCCYLSVGSCLPCLPIGSDISRRDKILGHLVAGSPMGLTKLQKKSKSTTRSNGVFPYFLPMLALHHLAAHSVETRTN